MISDIILESENFLSDIENFCKENLYFYSGLQNEDLEIDSSIQKVLDRIEELKILYNLDLESEDCDRS